MVAVIILFDWGDYRRTFWNYFFG